jgi:hypothetical protein
MSESSSSNEPSNTPTTTTTVTTTNGNRGNTKNVKEVHAVLSKAASEGLFNQGKTVKELQEILGVSECRIRAFTSKSETAFSYRFCRNGNYNEGPWTSEEEEQLIEYALNTNCNGPWGKVIEGRLGYECQSHLKYIVTHPDVNKRPTAIQFDEEKGYMINGTPCKPQGIARRRNCRNNKTNGAKRFKQTMENPDKDDDAPPQRHQPLVITKALVTSYGEEMEPSIAAIKAWIQQWMEPIVSSSSSSLPREVEQLRKALHVMEEFNQMIHEAVEEKDNHQ